MRAPERHAQWARALGVEAPEEALAALLAFYREVDTRLGAPQETLPCRSGCSACCHEAVFVSAPEVFAVMVALDEIPGRLATVTAEMLAIATRFADELELLEDIEPGFERDEVAERVKFSCPMLTPTGGCSVYGVRELNARTFGQSWDGARGAPFGCELTQGPLRVLQDGAGLVDARDLRRELSQRVPGVGPVHVYPWWFRKLSEELSEG